MPQTNPLTLAEVEEAERDYAEDGTMCGVIYRRLLADWREQREDGERLDWLLETCATVTDRGTRHKQLIRYACCNVLGEAYSYGNTPRAAIDAALAKEAPCQKK
jgi:hypothetical protein